MTMQLPHPGQVLPQHRLTDYVYDWDADHDRDVIEVYMKQLRQKCGKGVSRTRRGQGYVCQAVS